MVGDWLHDTGRVLTGRIKQAAPTSELSLHSSVTNVRLVKAVADMVSKSKAEQAADLRAKEEVAKARADDMLRGIVEEREDDKGFAAAAAALNGDAEDYPEDTDGGDGGVRLGSNSRSRAEQAADLRAKEVVAKARADSRLREMKGERKAAAAAADIDTEHEAGGVGNGSETAKSRAILLLLGPQAVLAGPRLADKYAVPTLKVSEMLNEAVGAGAAMGMHLHLKALLDSGAEVDDSLVVGVIEARIEQADGAGGFILGDFPRTLEQATLLDTMLAERGETVSKWHGFGSPSAVMFRIRHSLSCATSFHRPQALALKPSP